MNDSMKLYFEYDCYKAQNANGSAYDFVFKKLKEIPLDDVPAEARELVARALCDTISAATNNLKEIVDSGPNAENTACKQRREALSELRDAIGNEKYIPDNQRIPMFKRLCAWLLGQSWKETITLAKDVLDNGDDRERIDDDFASSTLDDVSMPEGAKDTIKKTSGFLDQASRYNLFMAQGAISNHIIEILKDDDNAEEAEEQKNAMPEIVQAAFTTEILSQEEEELKKLVALEWLLAVVHEKGRDAVMSPLVVVKIARDAFVKVNDLKATIKRLEAQMAHSGEEVKQ